MRAPHLLQSALERHRTGKLGEAVSLYRQILRDDPENADALHLLGVIASESGERAMAVSLIERALTLAPAMCAAWNNLGGVLFEQGRLDEAGLRCLHALRLEPRFTEAWYNLGNIRQEQRRFDEALECYGRALAIDPDHARARWNRGLLYLLLGDYEKGWEDYEWRWRNPELPTPEADYPRPVWDGSDLGGAPIFLYAEQGMGDAIQFARYVPLVQERGGKVILGCERPLARLLARIPGIQAIVTPGSAIPPFACHASLLSLPRILRTRLDTVPAHVPYLDGDDALARAWAERLAAAPGLRVGVAWRGNPAQKVNGVRSCPPSLLAGLAEVPNVSLFSLQKEPDAEGVPRGFHDLAADLTDYAETAACIASLDLVISVCTSVAHVAGALGRPLWVMLAYNADWRWLRDRKDSPWYPTARLFRQNERGDWPGVLDRVARELRHMAQADRRIGDGEQTHA